MEKRALLAFVLSLLIVTVWSYLFVPQEKPKGPVREIQEEGKEQSVQADFLPKPEREPLEVLKQEGGDFQEELVEITTPLYVAVLSTSTATIQSWRLTRYRESLENGSPSIELVRAGGRALELTAQGEMAAEMAKVRFRTDPLGSNVDATSAARTIRAFALLEGGGRIEKEFTFYPDRYVVDVVVRACDREGRPLAERLGLALSYPKSEFSRKSGVFAGPVALSPHGLEELDVSKQAGRPMEARWGGVALHYFLSAIVPSGPGRKDLFLEDSKESVRVTLWGGPAKEGGCDYRFLAYFGPKSIEDLKAAGEDLDKALHLGFFDIIARPLLLSMKFINEHTHNYGIAIIVLTIVIKLIFWPLTHKSFASMREMQKLQPRIKQIRERFKDDREQLNREMMLLYKTHKINPLGGCLPMLLQIPVFFALYKALMDSIELRHAPFVFWIKDLSGPDYLLRFPPGMSFFGIEGIGPLPLVMGVSMVIQQKMTPSTGDPTQAKVMMLMPIFFTFLFISFPSGLVLYWLMNNVLSIVQQIYINARLD